MRALAGARPKRASDCAEASIRACTGAFGQVILDPQIGAAQDQFEFAMGEIETQFLIGQFDDDDSAPIQ